MTKWKTLQHNGILFPPAYEAQGIKIKIIGELVTLTIDQEEMVYQWAKKKDTPYAQDKVFQKNFTADLVKTLDTKFKKISYEDIDFLDAYTVVDKEKDLKEMMTKEEKKEQAKKRKEIREELKTKYGVAIMDGKEPRPPEDWDDSDDSTPTAGQEATDTGSVGPIGGPAGEH